MNRETFLLRKKIKKQILSLVNVRNWLSFTSLNYTLVSRKNNQVFPDYDKDRFVSNPNSLRKAYCQRCYTLCSSQSEWVEECGHFTCWRCRNFIIKSGYALASSSAKCIGCQTFMRHLECLSQLLIPKSSFSFKGPSR